MATNRVGIDLGTTFSAIATLDDRGQPLTIPNRDGEILTPSAILLLDQLAVVGQPALDVCQEQPEQVATLVKRSMGLERFPKPLAGKPFRPETLSAIILRKLVQDASLQIGPIESAVITVPAYFDDQRRKATQDAGRIAGLESVAILDEPVAAALAYSFRQTQTLQPREQTVLVYDLGGGTFDVTVVRLGPKWFQTLAIEGDVRLGGHDWDCCVVDSLARAFEQQFGSDPRTDEQSLASLLAAVERAKRTLSKLDRTTITVNHAGHKLTVPMSRSEFEELTRHLLLRTRLTTQRVLQHAKLTWSQIDSVLLVGGSTHMPMTRQMLQDLSGKSPDASLAVSEVVARGAALHAGILAAKQAAASPSVPRAGIHAALADVVEINVSAHSLGIEIRSEQGRMNDKLILRNTELPVSQTRVYRTTKENQRHVRVRVLQGEAAQADACMIVGECWIEDLPENLPKGAPIQVQCTYRDDGRIDVMALELNGGKIARTTIHRQGGLSDAELRSEAEWVASLRIE
ncbi:Hsp70 family protein [Tuwongella immobilis]|uniref:Uncharacterized protein n=1 Tax=Tuwongella immobilis TaxID=692036 RepID=A0A6C2YMX6_9BACT|nr:Hsp70 family protein [Tuwongella immobilis]VIP02262.1 Dnak protein, truncation OS=Planctomyces maris DSM 8797 GN=PM8797T_05145 PE=3 SV=1: HSP70: HSP70 [Tuwongella immobilis]VTS00873.1 Dnak protein, truncation OS=Planctomyces maris DSM 8797 GN=PM8797T_05145 PE=3 SV=1: HSP70: HSP70 [Tuwongella immobilis]